MMIQTKAILDLKGFEALRRGLTAGQYTKLGVFGDHKAERTDNSISNLEDAIIQEFGSVTRHIPARSFIRMPIQEKRRDILAFAASKKMRGLLLAGDKKKALALLGVFCENIIQQAFDTGGFGKWAKNAWATVQKKHSGKPLINTSQLRRAVWSRVSGV